MSKNSFLKGTAILTLTMLISKILGFIYVIPFTNLVGTEGLILYEYAYKPYAIMLSLATLGLPAAVSKMISKYNELGDYETGRRLFKTGTVILTFAGFLWASLLYIIAPVIAELLVGKEQTTGNSIQDVVFVIRMVSFALIIVPPMALGRGYFQGNMKMNPTGISQVVEQFVRIIVILLSSFMIMYFGSKDIKTAVGWSTFAATIGAMASILVLLWYWGKYKKELFKANSTNAGYVKPGLTHMYKELLLSSIPFVIVSLAIPVYQNIDIFTINPVIVAQQKNLAEAEYINSIVALVQKITTLPIIFANAFALTLIPTITKLYISKDFTNMNKQITKTIQIIIFVTLPCAVFFAVFGQETFSILLGVKDSLYGGQVTTAYAGIAIFMSFFLVTAAILQGINKQGYAVFSFLAGLIIKLLTAKLFINLFSGEGTAYSTMLGMSISIFLNLIIIRINTHLQIKPIIYKSLKVILLSLLTTILLVATKYLCHLFLPIDNNTYAFNTVVVLIGGVILVVFYLGISWITGIFTALVGHKFKNN